MNVSKLVAQIIGKVLELCKVHTTKDKILLESEYSRYSDDDDEDEVFALKGMPEDSRSEEEEK